MEQPQPAGEILQYQVILNPPPANIQQKYLNSLKAIGLNPLKHDVRWIEDDWESPTLGLQAWAGSLAGWMEVTQFTYFQQMPGSRLNPITVEITYGLERSPCIPRKKTTSMT